MEERPLTEQEEIQKTRARIRLMKLDVDEIKSGLGEIKSALLGSALTQDGGLIKRVIENESRMDKLTIRVSEIERKESEQHVYIKILWTIAGTVLVVLAGAVATHYIK